LQKDKYYAIIYYIEKIIYRRNNHATDIQNRKSILHKKLKSYANSTMNYIQSRWKIYWKSYLILLIIHVVGILAILQADVYYADDVDRTARGFRGFGNTFGRWVSEYLSALLHTGRNLTNISPLTQLLAVAICAASALILIRVITETEKFSKWTYLAVIPLGLSPYFLECLSYQYDAPYMVLSVFFCIFPLLFAEKSLWIYGIVSFFCQLFMCESYQASSGIYSMLVLLMCFLAWNRGESTKSIGKFLLVSVAAYVAALILFEILCNLFANPDSISYVDASIPTGTAFFENAFENYKKFFSHIWNDFQKVWKLLIAIILFFFLFITTRESKRQKWLSLLCGGFTLIVLLMLPFGVLPFLASPTDSPRAMYGFGALLAMLTIVIVNAKPKFLNLCGKLSCVALSFCFLIFSNIYGNALQIQQDYTDTRTQTIIDDLIDLEVMDSEKTLYFQLDYTDDSWESPIFNKNPAYAYKYNNILGRLLGKNYGNTRWIEQKLTYYYDLDLKFDRSIDLSTYDLPVLVDNQYHTISGNDEYIYVVMK